ncbi:aldehyde dehydrogenase, partial [Mycobacterium avium subsp. hominissuis]
LPTLPLPRARTLANYLAAKAAGATPLLGADQVVADLGGGQAALRPAVHVLTEPDPELLNLELPFPCVWVTGWSREGGRVAALAPLRRSLVVTAITGDDTLIDALVAEPTIGSVYRGCPTWSTAPGVPHDGYLADALMRTKGFIGD